MQIPDFIETLVTAGIEINIGFHEDYGIYFDANTGAKSHCHLAYDSEGNLIAHMRYGETKIIKELADLCWEVKKCMYGRDYINNKWAEILVDNGYLEKKVETKISYY